MIFTFGFEELQYLPDPSQPPLAPGDRIENHVNITFVNPGAALEGLQLTPTDYPWLARDGNVSDVIFNYRAAEAVPKKLIFAANFPVTATITGTAGVLASETINSPNGTAGNPAAATLSVTQFTSGTSSDLQNFDRAVTNVGVSKDLVLITQGDGDEVNLTSFSQGFFVTGSPAAVPEPGPRW